MAMTAEPEHDKALAGDKPFSWPVRVYYEDTDAGGVVYYANYLRFMERARTELLRAAGVEQDRLREEQGLIFVVVAADIRYRRPARMNDLLEVRTKVSNSRRASIEFHQSVCLGETTLCEADVRVAAVDAASFRPRPIPPGLLEVSA